MTPYSLSANLSVTFKSPRLAAMLAWCGLNVVQTTPRLVSFAPMDAAVRAVLLQPDESHALQVAGCWDDLRRQLQQKPSL